MFLGKNLKKVIAVILSVVLVMSIMVGCSGSDDDCPICGGSGYYQKKDCPGC